MKNYSGLLGVGVGRHGGWVYKAGAPEGNTRCGGVQWGTVRGLGVRDIKFCTAQEDIFRCAQNMMAYLRKGFQLFLHWTRQSFAERIEYSGRTF